MCYSVNRISIKRSKIMQDYKTVEEKAVEWNITPRHIQYLCRTGKLEGAIKRAGSWFIPADMPTPAKNSKSGIENFNFVGTKKRVFDSAIELFMLNGFNNVSIKNIANKAGIRQSTLYNHFKSKYEILDTIYNFYCYYYLKDRCSLENIEDILQKGTLMDIIGYIRYNFKDNYLQKMSDITKIIFQRIGIDDRANKIAKSLIVDEGVKYVEDVFNRAVQIGRLAPFDTHAMAVFINSTRIFTLYNWLVDPDNMTKLLADEQTLYMYAAKYIKDIKPLI